MTVHGALCQDNAGSGPPGQRTEPSILMDNRHGHCAMYARGGAVMDGVADKYVAVAALLNA